MDHGRSGLRGTLLDGRYRIGEPLGSGATGVVFAAHSLADGRSLAVKVLRRELAGRADLGARLRREAEASRAIRHPGVVACLGEGTLPDGSPYVVFERLSGESLLHRIRRRGPLPLCQALAVARKTARVLAAVHTAGYVHRDVKSEHIWLAPEAGGLRIRLLDFGVCQAPHESEPLWPSGYQVLGTPGYLAPEQAAGSGPASARSDLYGLGATLFEALAGEPPYTGGNAAVLLRLTLSQDPRPLGLVRRDVPRGVEQLVQRLLAREPSGRPLNARVLERSLTAAADTPLTAAELALAAELSPVRDTALVQTLDEGRPTRSLAAVAGL